MSSVKAILLDLGGVVYELDWEKPLKMLGLEKTKVEHILSNWVHNPHYDQFERGKMSFTDFQQVFHDGIFREIAPDNFRKAWNSLILGPFPEVEALVQQYKSKIPIYALSNINEPHWDCAREEFTVMSHFTKTFTSYEIGLRKPEREIYQHVLDEIGLRAEEVLFVDDSPANIEQAKQMGFKAELCVSSPKKLVALFEQYTS